MHLYTSLADYFVGEREKLDQLFRANIPEVAVITRVLASPSGMTKQSHPADYSINADVSFLEIDREGIIGDRHHRSVRLSTGREREFLPRGSPVREHRHLFAVSAGDCVKLSDLLDVAITPELLGANLVIERFDGEPYSLSALPQGTYLRITPAAAEDPRSSFAVLQKYVTQEGCGVTGNAISQHYGRGIDLTKKFVDAAKLHRGIVCSVEFPADKPVRLEPGQKVFFGFPKGYAP